MKSKYSISALILVIAVIFISSCSGTKGTERDRNSNLEKAVRIHYDDVLDIHYIGMSYKIELKDGKFLGVIIYSVTDSIGNQTKRRARVTMNHDCTEIYSWEELYTDCPHDVKYFVKENQYEESINPIDGSLIDAVIELRKH